MHKLLGFLKLFSFMDKQAEAVNVMQTLCWAPAEEYPIKKAVDMGAYVQH